MSGLELKAFPIGVAGDQSRLFRIRFEGDAQGLTAILKSLVRFLPFADPADEGEMMEIYEAVLRPLGLKLEGGGNPTREIITYVVRKLLQLSFAFKLGYEYALREVKNRER